MHSSRIPRCAQFFIYISFNFVVMVVEVPLIRLVEQAACYQHYGRPVEEEQCKIPSIQTLLSSIFGWKILFDSVPSICMAICFGEVSQISNYRRILVFSCFGYSLMLAWMVVVSSMPSVFPVTATWLSSIFLFIGGGHKLFNSMVFTLVSRGLAEHERTTHFLLLSVGPHFCRLIGPRIAAVLMNWTSPAPFCLAFGCLGAIMALVRVATWESYREDKSSRSSRYLLLNCEGREISPEISDAEAPTQPETENGRKTIVNLEGLVRQVTKTFAPFDNTGAQFCLAAFLLKKIAFSSEGFMFQYTSEKFGWELRQTTWLRFVSAVGAVVATLILGPLLNQHARRRGVPGKAADLGTIRASLAILAASFWGAWASSSGTMFMIATLGCGLGESLEPALQGLLLSCTESHNSARVFTSVALCDTVAELIGGPLTARLLSFGRRKNHPSDGIPFLVCAGLFSSIFTSSFMVTD